MMQALHHFPYTDTDINKEGKRKNIMERQASNTMSFMQFQDCMTAEIRDFMPEMFRDAVVSLAPVSKLGSTYTGLTVRLKGQHTAPAANLDLLYEQYRDGRDTDDILRETARNLSVVPDAELAWILDYNRVRDRLYLRVSKASANAGRLKNTPHRIVSDLVLTVHIRVDLCEGGHGNAMVDNALLKKYGITADQLFDDALENAPNINPATLMPLSECVTGEAPDPAEQQVLVLSSREGIHGASALFYPGMMEEIAKVAHGGYYALPSSIHEWIIMPDGIAGPADELNSLVRGVNQTVVLPEDLLSDHAYHYDPDRGMFEDGETYEALNRSRN